MSSAGLVLDLIFSCEYCICSSLWVSHVRQFGSSFASRRLLPGPWKIKSTNHQVSVFVVWRSFLWAVSVLPCRFCVRAFCAHVEERNRLAYQFVFYRGFIWSVSSNGRKSPHIFQSSTVVWIQLILVTADPHLHLTGFFHASSSITTLLGILVVVDLSFFLKKKGTYMHDVSIPFLSWSNFSFALCIWVPTIFIFTFESLVEVIDWFLLKKVKRKKKRLKGAKKKKPHLKKLKTSRKVLKKSRTRKKKKSIILWVWFESAELCIDSYIVLNVVGCLLELELSLG